MRFVEHWANLIILLDPNIYLYRPSSTQTLMLYVDGMSESICRLFGNAFIKEVNKFSALKKLKTNVPLCIGATNAQQDLSNEVRAWSDFIYIMIIFRIDLESRLVKVRNMNLSFVFVTKLKIKFWNCACWLKNRKTESNDI